MLIINPIPFYSDFFANLYFNTSNVNNKQDFLEKRKQKKEYFNTSNVNNKPIFYKWICYNFPISIHQMLIINNQM